MLLISYFLTAACNLKVGWPIKTRSTTDTNGFTVVAPKQRFFCYGEVTAWRYQTEASNEFQAIVFRPLDAGHTQFQIIGINDISAGVINTPVKYNVPEGDRIKVQRGDVIGWSFEEGILSYDTISSSGGSNLVRWIDRTQYSLHDNITFDDYGSREYSIEATVQVSKNINLFSLRGDYCMHFAHRP